MRIEIEGDASPPGWPAPGCPCASCAPLRRRGENRAPLRILVDGLPLGELEAAEVPGGLDIRTGSGGRLLYGHHEAWPEPAPGAVYDAVLLDLLGCPEHLAVLRRLGAVASHTEIHAVHVDHRVRDAAELRRRLEFWRAPVAGPHRTLLLGGSRSGKSAEAELRLIAHPEVTYLATGPRADGSDPEWDERVRSHRVRRPSWWRVVESDELSELLRSARGAILVDGLGTWLASVMDRTNAWEDPDAVRPLLTELVAAWRHTEAVVVAVSDEVGLSLVPENRAGRLFRDLLGELNQRLVAESEDAALVVAGRPLPLWPGRQPRRP